MSCNITYLIIFYTVFLAKNKMNMYRNVACYSYGKKSYFQFHFLLNLYLHVFPLGWPKMIKHLPKCVRFTKGKRTFTIEINSKTHFLRKFFLNFIFSTTFPLINYSGIKGSFKNHILKNASCFS